MENEKGKISTGLVIGLVVASLIVVGIVSVTSFVYLNAPKEVQERRLDGGNIRLTYSDDDSSLQITSVTMIDDIAGMKINKADSYFDFSVAVDLDEASNIEYEISVIPDSDTTIPTKYIKVYLEKMKSGSFVSTGNPDVLTLSSKITELGSKKGSMVLLKESTKKSGTENYRLRAWVDSTSQYLVTATDKIILNVEVNGKAS